VRLRQKDGFRRLMRRMYYARGAAPGPISSWETHEMSEFHFQNLPKMEGLDRPHLIVGRYGCRRALLSACAELTRASSFRDGPTGSAAFAPPDAAALPADGPRSRHTHSRRTCYDLTAPNPSNRGDQGDRQGQGRCAQTRKRKKPHRPTEPQKGRARRCNPFAEGKTPAGKARNSKKS